MTCDIGPDCASETATSLPARPSRVPERRRRTKTKPHPWLQSLKQDPSGLNNSVHIADNCRHTSKCRETRAFSFLTNRKPPLPVSLRPRHPSPK